jgi:hypothetical protein
MKTIPLMQSKFPLSKTPLANKVTIPWKTYYHIRYNGKTIYFEKSYEIDTKQLHKICDEYCLKYYVLWENNKENKPSETIFDYDFETKSFGNFIEQIKNYKEISKHQREYFIQIAKKYRQEHINPTKNWEDVLPKNIQTWAMERLAVLSKDCDCVDNYRVANCKKSSQTRRYKRYQKGGCCGFFDTKELCPIDNKWYFLGFNYGH